MACAVLPVCNPWFSVHTHTHTHTHTRSIDSSFPPQDIGVYIFLGEVMLKEKE